MLQDGNFQGSRQHARSGLGRVPGIWSALAVLVASAGLFSYVGLTRSTPETTQTAAGQSQLAEVAPADMPDALKTVDESPDQLKQFKDGEACRSRLASITLARDPGQPAGRIRLQSGHYISPAFDLSDAPVRVALPYPAPYAAGHGTISVVGSTASVQVALTPPWHVQPQGGWQARNVTWTPVGGCPTTNK